MADLAQPNPENTIRLEFDGPEGKGIVEIESGSCGPYIWVNGKCLALVDLYYFSDGHLSDAAEDDEPSNPHPAIVFYEPDTHEDAFGGIHWYSGRIEVLIERERVELRRGYFETNIVYRVEQDEDDEKKSRTQLKRELQDVINSLANAPCTFWACPGPNKPREDMATCRICNAVKDLIEIKKEL